MENRLSPSAVVEAHPHRLPSRTLIYMPLKDGTSEDYQGAAVRHYLDARSLMENGQHDNAGHLIGFAAECAIKHQMYKTAQAAVNLHLPELLPAARRQLGSRVGYTSMYDLLKKDCLAGWSIDHRYSPTGKISLDLADKWCQDAKRILAAAGLKVHAKGNP